MIGSEWYSETRTVRPFGRTRSVTFGIVTAAAGGPIGGGVASPTTRSAPPLQATGQQTAPISD